MQYPYPLQDDPSIPDTELLYRGVVRDYVTIEGEVSSAAFKTKNRENVSVDRSSLTSASENLRRLPRSVGVAELLTRLARAVTPGVASTPMDSNLAHAEILRDTDLGDTAWSRVARQLARGSSWAIRPSANKAL
jgi:hypothetical protein